MASKTELDKSADSVVKAACKECGRNTNHMVLKSVDESGSQPMGDGEEYGWSNSYQIIRCQGCDTTSFRSVSSNSEDYGQIGPDEEGLIERESLYPDRTVGRQVIKDWNILPLELQNIYHEAVDALNGNLPILAGVGIRAIVETIARDQQASGRDLRMKIDALVTLGVLTKDGANVLHKLRVLGNNAAHKVKAHSVIELNLAMDVVDHVLQAVYILPFHAKRVFQ